MSPSAVKTDDKKEDKERDALLRAIADRLQVEDDNRSLIARIQRQIDQERLAALGFNGAFTRGQSQLELSDRFLPGIKSMTHMVETVRIVLEKLQEEVRESVRRLEPPPHEKPLTVIHCTGRFAADEMLSSLIKVTGDLDQAGALLLDYAVRSDSQLFKQAVSLYHRLKDYSEIADQNRVAAVNCAKEYEVPAGKGAGVWAVAA